MNSNKNIVAEFQNKYGETKRIRSTRNGLQVMRDEESHCHVIGNAIASYIGERVRAIRQSKDMTMDELGLRAGLTTGSNMKQRIYDIETNKQGKGIRFGTLYQLAIALEVEITELVPTTETVKNMTGAKLSNTPSLSRQ